MTGLILFNSLIFILRNFFRARKTFGVFILLEVCLIKNDVEMINSQAFEFYNPTFKTFHTFLVSKLMFLNNFSTTTLGSSPWTTVVVKPIRLELGIFLLFRKNIFGNGLEKNKL